MAGKGKSWSQRMLEVVKWCNAFDLPGSTKAQCRPFLIEGQQVGVVPPDVILQLKKFPRVFEIAQGSDRAAVVTLSPELKTYEDRTEKVHQVIEALREQDLFVTLRGWRSEKYVVRESYQALPLMEIERSATTLFGITQYAVHINGYTHHPEKGLCLWIARRSPTKQTFPGKLDNISAGGLPAGMKIFDCLLKECQEEACIPESIAKQALPVGTTSYCYEDERGISPVVEFVYDLELPLDFQPRIGDGEVSEFHFCTVEQAKELIASGDFKPNSALTTLSFLIRRGFINPDTEPNYQLFIEGMHRSMHF